jgi:CRISPR-associated endonuclease/helicase Cas3/CRISPR-associated endonuclease Cas3-HD
VPIPDGVFAHVDTETDAVTSLVDHHREVADRTARLAARLGDGTTTTVPTRDLLSVASLTHDLGKATGKFQRYLRGEASSSPHPHALVGALATATVCDALGYEGADLLVPTFAVARHHTPFPGAETPLRYFQDVVADSRGQHSTCAKIVRAIDHDDATSAVADRLCRAASDDAVGWPAVRDSLSGETPATDRDGDVYQTLRSTIEGPIPESLDDGVLSRSFYGDLLAVWSGLVLADKTAAAGIDLARITPLATDSTSTAGGDADGSAERRSVSPDGLQTATLREHVASLGAGTALDEVRDEAHRRVMYSLDAVDDLAAPGVYTIQLATGLGKTLTGLHAAMRLRDAAQQPTSIVYALPYTSIIDQTADVIADVFDVDPTDPSFTVHHHLRPTVSRFDGRDDDPDGAAETAADRRSRSRSAATIAKTWQADLTVTTFVQLFESLLNPANTQLLKLPNLAGATIVLDEPQALPPIQWALLRDALRVLVDRFGCRVVLMTATQPALFDGAPEIEPTPLVAPATARAFHERSAVERVHYRFHPSVPRRPDANTSERPLATDRAAALIIDETPPGGRAMAICNTIESANALSTSLAGDASDGSTVDTDGPLRHVSVNEVDADLIESQQPSPADLEDALRARVESLAEGVDAGEDGSTDDPDDGRARPVLVTGHLTARHRPVDRRRLLAVLDSFSHPRAIVVLVATQVVEAGVDISFDRVYRDYAPLPNVVQAAGRCNREFERDRGVVTVWQLGSTDETTATTTAPGTYVYSRGGAADYLAATTTVLRETVYDREPDCGASVSTSGTEDGAETDLSADGEPSTDGPPTVRADAPTVAHDAVAAYYEELTRRQVGQRSETDVSRCATGELRSYRLIERYGTPVEVFVCRSAADERRVDRIRTAMDEHRWDDVDRLLRVSADRRVSITRPGDGESALEAETPRIGETTIHVLDERRLRSAYFDPTTGLSLDGATTDGVGQRLL